MKDDTIIIGTRYTNYFLFFDQIQLYLKYALSQKLKSRNMHHPYQWPFDIFRIAYVCPCRIWRREVAIHLFSHTNIVFLRTADLLNMTAPILISCNRKWSDLENMRWVIKRPGLK